MKITFDVKTSIVVPNADFAPEKGELEKMLIQLLKGEGIDAISLLVDNYYIIEEDEE